MGHYDYLYEDLTLTDIQEEINSVSSLIECEVKYKSELQINQVTEFNQTLTSLINDRVEEIEREINKYKGRLERLSRLKLKIEKGKSISRMHPDFR